LRADKIAEIAQTAERLTAEALKNLPPRMQDRPGRITLCMTLFNGGVTGLTITSEVTVK